ncbi:MAG: ArdC family protein [Planctomycetota bacterium]
MKKNQTQKVIDEAIEQLAAALANGQSDAMKKYLLAMAKFSAYSIGNILLILAQRPQATRIAGYRTWQELGRNVKKGEKGILITAPVVLRKKRGDRRSRAPPADKEEDMILHFKAVHVFDISQTDGKPLPEPARVGGNPNGQTEKLKAFVASKGIALDYSSSLGTADGQSQGRKITIREGLQPAEEFSVLVHEVAHSLLHFGDLATSKTVRETEAEAVAFVVCQAIGLESGTSSSDYIQLYRGDKETLAQSLERIQRTASAILDAITTKT